MNDTPHSLRLGDHVIVDGGGSGKIVGFTKRFEEKDTVQVNYGKERCHCCGKSTARVEWARARHVHLTVGERDRRKAGRVGG